MIRWLERAKPWWPPGTAHGYHPDTFGQFFALFHGERPYERALCAGISLKTFSERHLVPLIKQHMGATVPETGFKAGLAAGTLAVKRVGAPRRSKRAGMGAETGELGLQMRPAGRHPRTRGNREGLEPGQGQRLRPLVMWLRRLGHSEQRVDAVDRREPLDTPRAAAVSENPQAPRPRGHQLPVGLLGFCPDDVTTAPAIAVSANSTPTRASSAATGSALRPVPTT